jgi:hypothetical protein
MQQRKEKGIRETVRRYKTNKSARIFSLSSTIKIHNYKARAINLLPFQKEAVFFFLHACMMQTSMQADQELIDTGCPLLHLSTTNARALPLG